MTGSACPPPLVRSEGRWARREERLCPPYNLHHRPMPRDAGLQDLVDRLLPPIVGKNLDLGIAAKTLRLDRPAQSLDVDHAIAHHAAVVENVLGRHQPVADVKRLEAILSGAFDLRQHIRIPPDVS